MNVEILNTLDHKNWNEKVNVFPEATVFHSLEWAKVLTSTYGYTPCYFSVSHDEKNVAVIPIMEVNSFLSGKRGVSLPFTDFCEPLFNGAVDIDMIFNTIKQYGKKAGWQYFEMKGIKKSVAISGRPKTITNIYFI